MYQINEFVDERQKSWCIHCGAGNGGVDTNRDHVPSRTLLRKPYPANLPVVRICSACNESFSRDEEYLSLFLRCVIAGTTDPDGHKNPKVARALKRHDKLRARIERSKSERWTVDGESVPEWQPEIERVNQVVLKNARGHAFYEYGEPMMAEPARVWAAPLAVMSEAEREAFEDDTAGTLVGWPEVGSRMMIRAVEGQDLRDAWIVVQKGVYRYRVDQCDTLRVRSIIHEYLATEVCWTGS